MKFSSLFLTLIVFFGAPFSCAFADGAVPVCFWTLHDEDIYYSYRADLSRFDWREIRKRRQLSRTVFQDPKHLEISWLAPDGTMTALPAGMPNALKTAEVVVRDPNGVIHSMPIAGPLTILEDPLLMGRYLVGAHILWTSQDLDGDGIKERVHLCAKHMVMHRKNGAKMGRASVLFLDDPETMPLEIGPVFNTAKSRFGGGFQTPHNTYEMMVKYAGQPLPGARVKVMALGSHWQNIYLTDTDGKFEVQPTDDRSVSEAYQKYLYVATHHDRSQNSYYVASFPVMVYKNQPEWRSKTLGFTLWSIVGSALSLLVVLGFVKRNQWLDQRTLVIFNNRKIRKDLE